MGFTLANLTFMNFKKVGKVSALIIYESTTIAGVRKFEETITIPLRSTLSSKRREPLFRDPLTNDAHRNDKQTMEKKETNKRGPPTERKAKKDHSARLN
ncbi:hypothetical protein TcasGA2_TC001305 [Tribolium castaneum]|uniref:Uncharacterized protein n=1 Tax=Tribolium castaneum TaxID=7070 RepID=D6WBT7_TRICA|nr:hypothetical protein TcasGA2_TC001305 [Tribolium castaneum]